ncbi:MAG: type IV secretion system protein [Clostridia bacterium]|nr:type IV secretion system protein [Clostridia bacterium]
MGWLVNFEESIKELLISLITSMLGELFVMTSDKFSDFTAMIGQTPQTWNPGIYSMVQSLSSTVIVPAANIILTLVVSLELFGMLVERNNMVDIEPAFLVKWIFKAVLASFVASNAWTITMAVFDLSQNIAASASGLLGGTLSPFSQATIDAFVATLETETIGRLVLILLQSVLSWAILFLITVGILVLLIVRMVEIYLTVSIAPIPFAAFYGKEWTGGMGANYLRSLFALGFQGFFIMVCLSIYTTMMQNVLNSTDVVGAMWSYIAYSGVLLFAVGKTDRISKSIFGAH